MNLVEAYVDPAARGWLPSKSMTEPHRATTESATPSPLLNTLLASPRIREMIKATKHLSLSTNDINGATDLELPAPVRTPSLL